MLNAGNAIAATVSAPLGSYLGGIVGWRGAFFFVVPLALLALVWQWVAMPSLPPRGRPGRGNVFRLLGRAQVALGMTAILLLFMGQFALFTYLRPFLETAPAGTRPTQRGCKRDQPSPWSATAPSGVMGALAASQMGAGRIIAMSRHKTRQDLALEYGATDIVSERGDAGVARIKELTGRVGADAVLECVGTQELMIQAIQCARPGAMIGCVGVPHGVELDGQSLFFSQTGMQGGPAPVRRFLPHLMDLVLTRQINPGKAFDLELPLADVAEGYRAMHERCVIKTLLRV